MPITVSVTQFSGGQNPNPVAYPFDIWDGAAKTIVYKLGDGETPPHWMGAYRVTAEMWASVQNELYSSKNGILWEHNNPANPANFYGTQYSAKVMAVANMAPNAVKVYNAVAVESNIKPSFTYFYTQTPYAQSTDLISTDYRDYEGMWYATLYRNKLQPTATGYSTDNLLTGEKMRTYALFTLFEFEDLTVPLELRFVNFNFDLSRGHTTQPK